MISKRVFDGYATAEKDSIVKEISQNLNGLYQDLIKSVKIFNNIVDNAQNTVKLLPKCAKERDPLWDIYEKYIELLWHPPHVYRMFSKT